MYIFAQNEETKYDTQQTNKKTKQNNQTKNTLRNLSFFQQKR